MLFLKFKMELGDETVVNLAFDCIPFSILTKYVNLYLRLKILTNKVHIRHNKKILKYLSKIK